MASDGPRSLPKPIPANAALMNLPHLIEKDPGLMLTPEKSPLQKKTFSDTENEITSPKLPSGVLTQRKLSQEPTKPEAEPEKVDLIPTKLTSIINDPTLDVTPEKPPTVLKKGQTLAGSKLESLKNSRNFRVRFDVPESSHESEESFASDMTPLENSSENNGPSRTERILQEPFKKRAALYVQRNPLADITSDSSLQETLENTTGSETLISTDSENSSGSFFNKITQFIEHNQPKVADMKGKVIRGDTNITQQLPAVKLKTAHKPPIKPSFKQPVKVTKNKIINVMPEENRPPPRSVIDQVTRPKTKEKSVEPVVEKKPFLKKKSGLHRHEHSVRYDPEPTEDKTPLCGPTYNSTLSLGQELQELKVTEFNAKEAVQKKMEESERLRSYIAEKTAEATNINPDEKLYQNLVSVDVEPEELVTTNSAKWKRTKPKPYKPKKSTYGEPDIWETYNPEELYFADPMLDFESLKPEKPSLEPVPLQQIMWVDQHEQLWNGAWGWKL